MAEAGRAGGGRQKASAAQAENGSGLPVMPGAAAAITRLATPRIVRLGMGAVPEATRILADMIARENLLIGAHLRRARAAVAEEYEQVLEQFPRLKERLAQRGGVLSGGEQTHAAPSAPSRSPACEVQAAYLVGEADAISASADPQTFEPHLVAGRSVV